MYCGSTTWHQQVALRARVACGVQKGASAVVLVTEPKGVFRVYLTPSQRRALDQLHMKFFEQGWVSGINSLEDQATSERIPIYPPMVRSYRSVRPNMFSAQACQGSVESCPMSLCRD